LNFVKQCKRLDGDFLHNKQAGLVDGMYNGFTGVMGAAIFDVA
jgi:hypothetical protein